MPAPEFRRVVSALVAALVFMFWAVVLILGVIYTFSENTSDFLTSEGLRYVMPGLTAMLGGLLAAVYALPQSTLQRLGNLLLADAPRKNLTTEKKLAAVAYKVLFFIGGAMAVATWIANGTDTIEFVKTVSVVWGGSVLAIVVGYYD